MCYMDEETQCTVGEKLDNLRERFDALESRMKWLMQRLDNHDKVVRWTKNVTIFLLGSGMGAGLLNSKIMALLMQI